MERNAIVTFVFVLVYTPRREMSNAKQWMNRVGMKRC